LKAAHDAGAKGKHDYQEPGQGNGATLQNHLVENDEAQEQQEQCAGRYAGDSRPTFELLLPFLQACDVTAQRRRLRLAEQVCDFLKMKTAGPAECLINGSARSASRAMHSVLQRNLCGLIRQSHARGSIPSVRSPRVSKGDSPRGRLSTSTNTLSPFSSR